MFPNYSAKKIEQILTSCLKEPDHLSHLPQQIHLLLKKIYCIFETHQIYKDIHAGQTLKVLEITFGWSLVWNQVSSTYGMYSEMKE